MQWSAIVAVVVFTALAGSVKGILAFSFCAIVSFILARNLLDVKSNLDFTAYFTSKGLGKLNEERDELPIATKPFPQGLKTIRHSLIRNILRDFVISWYENVGIGGEFILETRSLLEEATVKFYDKISRTSVSSHTEKLCILLHRHLVSAQTARVSMAKNHKENFAEIYCSLQEKTHTYQSDELQYLRNVTDLLLYRLVGPKTLGCDTGRFILREILAVRLLLPLVDTLSDPDFVNTSIINIFGEEADENLLTTPKEFNEASKSNSKVSPSLMEYLDQRSESNDSSNCSRIPIQSESATKYNFKGTTVIETEHKEIVEISMGKNSSASNSTSSTILQNDNNVSIPEDVKTNHQMTCKTSEASANKKHKLLTKELSHSSIINGLSKFKNDIFKLNEERENSNSKLKAILSSKIHPSGIMFVRNLRRFQSSPIMKQNTSTSLNESLSGESISVLNTEEASLTEGDDENSSSQSLLNDGSSLRMRNDVEQWESMPKSVSSSVDKASISSSFEEVDMSYNDSKAANIVPPGSCDSNIEPREPAQRKFETSSDDEETNFSPRSRQHTTSLSSNNDEWESEIFEKSDDGLIFDIGEDFSDTLKEADSLKVKKMQDDIVSSADFAIHDVPNPCSMISIPSTELVTDHSFEPYKSRYTVYVIEYNMQLWPCAEDEERAMTTRSGDKTQGCIKRRYREFMELHHRLISGTYVSFMKDVPKPNRKFNSPFFRLDQDVIEGRQQLLENYLKCLVNKPDILNCEDFKGFLGIGDKTHVDFRKHNHVPLPNVPRIDKKLQKKVTKFIDHIKTAFDTGPIDGDKEEEYDDIRQVLGEDKASEDEIRAFVICSGSCKLHHSCCFSDNYFHAFIQQHYDDETTRNTEHPSHEATKENSSTRLIPKSAYSENGHVSNDLRDGKQKSSKVLLKRKRDNTFLNNGSSDASHCQTEATNPLTKTVLNLSCKLLEERDSWLCLEPVQQAGTVVFGCFLEWWMDSLLSELVTEEQWGYYLTLLTDTVWPGGELLKTRGQEKSEEEKLKTKEEAIETLSSFFGAVLHAAVGKENIECSAREIVESFQCSEINRQVLFEALEVILTEVFPHLTSDKDLYLSSRNC